MSHLPLLTLDFCKCPALQLFARSSSSPLLQSEYLFTSLEVKQDPYHSSVLSEAATAKDAADAVQVYHRPFPPRLSNLIISPFLPRLQALNVLMLKILENCNRNHSFSALLSLLVKAPAEATGVAEQELRWADLVVKCLIKITKALPATLEVRHVLRFSFQVPWVYRASTLKAAACSLTVGDYGRSQYQHWILFICINCNQSVSGGVFERASSYLPSFI